MLLPPGDRRFIALDRPTAGALEAPAHLPQEPPHMAGMQPHSALAFDQRGHPRQGPEVVEKTVGLRPLFQRLLQGLLVRRSQLGPTAQRAPLPSRGLGGLALLFPAQGTDPADPTQPGNFRLRNAPREQAHAFVSPYFHAVEIPLGFAAHAAAGCYLFMRESIMRSPPCTCPLTTLDKSPPHVPGPRRRAGCPAPT